MWQLSQLCVHCKQPTLTLLPPSQELLLPGVAAKPACSCCLAPCLPVLLLLYGWALEQQLHKRGHQLALNRHTCAPAQLTTGGSSVNNETHAILLQSTACVTVTSPATAAQHTFESTATSLAPITPPQPQQRRTCHGQLRHHPQCWCPQRVSNCVQADAQLGNISRPTNNTRDAGSLCCVRLCGGKVAVRGEGCM